MILLIHIYTTCFNDMGHRSILFFRYQLELLASSVTGGGRVEGVLQGILIIQDSDEAHGVVQFTGPDVQQLITVCTSNMAFTCFTLLTHIAQ